MSGRGPLRPVLISHVRPKNSLHVIRMKTSNEQLDDRIVEVHWDNVGEHWRMMRFRDDKPNGNHKSVVDNIIKSIADGVEKDEVRAPTAASCTLSLILTSVRNFARSLHRSCSSAPRRSATTGKCASASQQAHPLRTSTHIHNHLHSHSHIPYTLNRNRTRPGLQTSPA